MPRDIPVGNGNLLVAFDRNYLLRDLYFPYVGKENHTNGHPFRLGFWVNGAFSWVTEEWAIRRRYLEETLVTDVALENAKLGIRVLANDLVDFYENIYLKRMTVENLTDRPQDVRVFFNHDFHLSGTEIGDTAVYRPDGRCLLHYKDDRYFLINIHAKGETGVHAYAMGIKEQGVMQGTWMDAEDGVLGGNPIAQGAVDSVAGVHLLVEPGSKETFFYWICAGKSWEDVRILNQIVTGKTPEVLFKRTADYWKLWVNKEGLNYELIPEKIARLYRQSLLIIRTQTDNRGGILAANDSDNMQFNRDTYSYVWTRDGALIAMALDAAGYFGLTRDFFNFCSQVITPEGYFRHKYTPTGDVGSSWHPWIHSGHEQMPIQEDETALVIWALWHHFKIYKDIEFIKPLYKRLVKNGADFMLRFRDPVTKLPLPSYDLWEERKGVLTFTTCSVYAGLLAAANFTYAFGETDIGNSYETAAAEIKDSMIRYLYLKDKKRFARMINFNKDGSQEVDETIDASLYSLFAFGVFLPDDERVSETMRQVYEKLWCNTAFGGLARYEGDFYHKIDDRLPGNPWIICTLWIAQYYIAKAGSAEELEKALEIMSWVADRALPSGVLGEQIHPHTGEPVSVSPLTWSHAAFVFVVQEYINKYLKLNVYPECGHPKFSKYTNTNPS